MSFSELLGDVNPSLLLLSSAVMCFVSWLLWKELDVLRRERCALAQARMEYLSLAYVYENKIKQLSGYSDRFSEKSDVNFEGMGCYE